MTVASYEVSRIMYHTAVCIIYDRMIHFEVYFYPIYYLRPSTLSPYAYYSRNSDPGSHSRLFSPPTHYGSCLGFLSRGDFSSFLVDSRRFVLTHARRSQQLILFSSFFFFFLQINSKSRHGGIRTHGPNTSSIRFELMDQTLVCLLYTSPSPRD